MTFWSQVGKSLARAVRSTVGGAIDGSRTGQLLAQQTEALTRISEHLAALASQSSGTNGEPKQPSDEHRKLAEEIRAVVATRVSKPDALASTLRALDDPERWHEAPVYWDLYQARSVLSYALWDHHAAIAAATYRRNRVRGAALETTGVLDGQLSESQLARLLTAWQECPPCDYGARDFRDGTMFNPWIFGGTLEQFNKFADYRRATTNMRGVVRDLLSELQGDLEEAMGHHWDVASIKLVSLHPLGTGIGPHLWHMDSHPSCTKKLMIYLCETGPETGSTEFEIHGGGMRTVEGPPGRWVLFENARVRHRGHPPAVKPRPVVELTLMPALETSTEVPDSGVNECCPWFPPVPDIPGASGYFSADAALERLTLRSAKLALHAGDVSPASVGIDNILLRP